MRILYLEDHVFFGDSVYEILNQDFPEHTIDYATGYNEAEAAILKNNYDISILDVVLKNGKTGIHFAEKFQDKLGKILFVTGCKDEPTLKALEKYSYVNKDIKVLDSIKEFININKK
jgi:DNA-binding response OmpR family regulator